ncbi:MAG: hypothetical protein LBM93_14035 [Oscillospiraceae bacterium]|jgi:hypothetical protein|nr:hypothetical protein [Oscillospiraceae bacterium]
MNNAYKIITCCGDESRDDFLQEFLMYSDGSIVETIFENGEAKNVVFINSNTRFESNKDTVVIPTELIPLGYVLEFPSDYFNGHSVLFGVCCDKLLMFNQFPYRKRHLIIELARMLKDVKTIDSEVVLMRTKRRFAATDIMTFEDTIDIALKDYAKIADRVSLYSTGEDKTNLFWIKASLQRNMKHRYIAAIDECMKKFNSEFDVKYAAGLGLRLVTNESILSKEPIIEEYILQETKRLYLYFLKDIMLWDNKAYEFLEDMTEHFKGIYKNNELKNYIHDKINERLLAILHQVSVAA